LPQSSGKIAVFLFHKLNKFKQFCDKFLDFATSDFL